MKKLAAFVGTLVLCTIVFFLWMARLPPFDGHPEPTIVAFSELSRDFDAVRVEGTAHYPVRLSVTRPARFGTPESVWWLFPLFDKGDTHSRMIYAMVLSPTEPDRLTAFEDMMVEGWLRPPAVAVPPQAEEALRDENYSFDPDYVLLELW